MATSFLQKNAKADSVATLRLRKERRLCGYATYTIRDREPLTGRQSQEGVSRIRQTEGVGNFTHHQAYAGGAWKKGAMGGYPEVMKDGEKPALSSAC